MAKEQNNGFLYFIVGALVVAVISVGYIMVQNDNSSGVATVETSSGGSNFKIEIDDNGFKASTEKDD
mgnify:CR=1 FL=1|jgi:hypothetical protein|tara:strand:- start:565 stop:765 length:201 start_codon:yes stop_codon:yes gene_type:complete